MKQKDWITIVVLVLGWIVFLGQPTKLSRGLRQLFAQLTTPLVKLGNFIPTVESRRELAKTNQRLTAENEVLLQRLRALEETIAENQRLQRLLEMKPRLSQRTIGARVIGQDISNWWKSIQIDVGSDDGVTVDSTVATAAGLVGKTVEVGPTSSQVLLLLDPNCKVSSMLTESRQPGVVAGAPRAFSRRPVLRMTYVDRATVVKPGEHVISAGHGGVFPKGIRIGTVLEAELNEETGMYQDIEIDPAVDFRRLEEVIVIVRTE